MKTVCEILRSHRIQLGRQRDGRQRDGSQRTICPNCSHTRHKKRQECLSVTIDKEGILWNCWHCGWHGGEFYEGDLGRGRGMAQSARRISRRTLERLGAASGTAFFRDLGHKAEALFFPYDDGWKARAFPDKAFVTNKGLRLAFWNIERVLRARPDTVFITEGELDALALVEAGISADAVLSTPNGAREKSAEDPQRLPGFAYVQEALQDGLRYAKRFVWCGDNDAPGLALRADMARLFGAARFDFVDWPEGCKDANDLLVTDGPEALRSLVEEGALPWPVDGIYRLNELPEPSPLTLWDPGFPEWEGKVMLAPRMLSVVTGHPGHGKTGALRANLVQRRPRLSRADFHCVIRDEAKAASSAAIADALLQRARKELDGAGGRRGRCLDKRLVLVRLASRGKAITGMVSRQGRGRRHPARRADFADRPMEPA